MNDSMNNQDYQQQNAYQMQNNSSQQGQYQNNGGYTPQYKPLSPWAYFGYNILFSLPLVGFILLIVFSFSDDNINRRNYARSFFVGLLFALIIGIIVFAIVAIVGIGAFGALGSNY